MSSDSAFPQVGDSLHAAGFTGSSDIHSPADHTLMSSSPHTAAAALMISAAQHSSNYSYKARAMSSVSEQWNTTYGDDQWPGAETSTDMTAGDEGGGGELEFSLVNVILISIVASALSIATAGGNLMVIVSFKMDRQLQTVSNYFLLSLSVADLSIGIISMPLYTSYLITGHWPLGPLVCDIWLSLDYTMSNASVANLLLICFDRYFSVTRPLTYRAKRTRRRAAMMIAFAWLVSILLWPPWIFAWPYIEGKRTVEPGQCEIQFLTTNQYITLVTAFMAFFLPVIIMCVLYFKIYLETQKRQKELRNLQANRVYRKNDDDDDVYACARAATLKSDSSPEEGGGHEELSAMLRGQYDNEVEVKGCWQKFRQCCSIDQETDIQEDSSSSGVVCTPSQTTSSQHRATISMRKALKPSKTTVRQNGHHTLFKPKFTPARNIPTIKIDSPKSKTTTKRLFGVLTPPSAANTSAMTLPVKQPDLAAIQEETKPKSVDSQPNTTIPVPENTASCSPEVSIDIIDDDGVHDDVIHANVEPDEVIHERVIHDDVMLDDAMYNDVIHNDVVRQDITHHDVITPDAVTDDSMHNDVIPDSSFDDGGDGESIGMKDFARQETTDTVIDDHDSAASSSTEDNHHHHHPAAANPSSSTERETRVYPSTPSVGRRLTQSSEALRKAMEARYELQNATKAKLKVQRAKKKRQEKRQEKKAVKTLSAILLAFIVTWTPYNIFTVIQALCQCEINSNLYAIGKWAILSVMTSSQPVCYRYVNWGTVGVVTSCVKELLCLLCLCSSCGSCPDVLTYAILPMTYDTMTT